MKLPRLLLILMLALAPALAWAQGFDLPGLSQESGAYQQSLQRRFPAGGTPQQRATAERRAQDATARRDFAAAAAALEERIGLGNSNGHRDARLRAFTIYSHSFCCLDELAGVVRIQPSHLSVSAEMAKSSNNFFVIPILDVHGVPIAGATEHLISAGTLTPDEVISCDDLSPCLYFRPE
jgi:hypothetical protein